MDSIRRVARNTASLLASDMMNRATTFVLYALVGRRLGAYEFGQMSLALTLFYVAQVVAVAGLKTLVTREVARDRAATDRYFVNASGVVFLSSLVSVLSMWLILKALAYSADTQEVILLLTLALLPYSLSAVTEGVFQAWEQMHYIAMANTVINVGKVVVAFLLLSQGFGLMSIIWLLVGSYVATLLVEWGVFAARVTKPRLLFDPRFSLGMVRITSTFLGIDVVIAIATNINVVLLSKLGNETQVGMYSAATQLMVPVTLLFNSTALSIFPIMCRRFESTFTNLKRISEKLIELMVSIALPALVGLIFLSPLVLGLLYGHKDFSQSAAILRVSAWTLIPVALTSVLGQVLLASLRERVNLRIVMVDAVMTLIIGFVLVSQFGLMGAAFSALAVRLVDLIQHLLAIARLPLPISFGRLFWKPTLASLAMAGYLSLSGDNETILTALTSVAIYAAVLGFLHVWTVGGIAQIRDRVTQLRSDPWIE